VRAPIRPHAPLPGGGGSTAGEALLSLAADVGADLLVMGCYGHSRARELVLGGASRTVLRSMTLPVLMAH
jgi:nucleotide-binding universal stress UspA family protein